MKEVLQGVDRLLARVPPDSIYGRAVKREILDHLGDSVAEKTGAGVPLEQALGEAVAEFGAPSTLERDYYRDYLRARYALGVFDREVFARPDRWLLRLGSLLLFVGLLLQLLVPTVGVYATAMGAASYSVNPSTHQIGEDAFAQGLDFALGNPLPPLFQNRVWGVVAVLGLLAFTAGGLWTLRRARLVSLAHPLSAVAFALLPLLAIGFVLAARPAVYAEALRSALLVTADVKAAARPLATAIVLGWYVGGALALCGLVVAVTARARGQVDSVGLRQAGIGLALLGAGVVAVAHPRLLLVLHAQATEDLAPAQLVGSLWSDLYQFVLGILLLAAGLCQLYRVAEDAQRTLISRGLG